MNVYASNAIRSRVDQLWASQTHLASNLGISKQVLAYRIKCADKYTCYWPYWCKLLIMDPAWLEKPEQDREKPELVAITMALVKYGDTYKQYQTKLGRPRKVKP